MAEREGRVTAGYIESHPRQPSRGDVALDAERLNRLFWAVLVGRGNALVVVRWAYWGKVFGLMGGLEVRDVDVGAVCRLGLVRLRDAWMIGIGQWHFG